MTERSLALTKFKDNNGAMSFLYWLSKLSSFNVLNQTVKIMVHSFVFEYLESEASRLQYWRGQTDTYSDPKQYHTQGGRPGKRRRRSKEENL